MVFAWRNLVFVWWQDANRSRNRSNVNSLHGKHLFPFYSWFPCLFSSDDFSTRIHFVCEQQSSKCRINFRYQSLRHVNFGIILTECSVMTTLLQSVCLGKIKYWRKIRPRKKERKLVYGETKTIDFKMFSLMYYC